MDGQVANVGDEGQAIGPRSEVLNRLAEPIHPMRRLFGEVEIDRRLVRGFVQAFANVKGLEYEEAHRRLCRMAEKVGFGAPDLTPDYLLKQSKREARQRIRAKVTEDRLWKENFGDDADGAGFRDPDPDGRLRDQGPAGPGRGCPGRLAGWEAGCR